MIARLYYEFCKILLQKSIKKKPKQTPETKNRKAFVPLYTSRCILISGHTIQNDLAKLEKLRSLC